MYLMRMGAVRRTSLLKSFKVHRLRCSQLVQIGNAQWPKISKCILNFILNSHAVYSCWITGNNLNCFFVCEMNIFVLINSFPQASCVIFTTWSYYNVNYILMLFNFEDEDITNIMVRPSCKNDVQFYFPMFSLINWQPIQLLCNLKWIWVNTEQPGCLLPT